MVFGDSTNASVSSSAPNQFVVAASGGILLATSKDLSTGCFINLGGGTWNCTSSKDVKRDFSEVDKQAVLERVAALPVQRWRYRNESPEIRHIGTFAQDFHSAFELGSDDKTISMADADGVALAAIQALYDRVRESAERLERKDVEIAELKRRLERIELSLVH
jgi:trimeric autotransporter adhesin